MGNDIITVQNDNIAAISDDRLIEIARRAEERVAAVIKMKQVALKVTNINDWVDNLIVLNNFICDWMVGILAHNSIHRSRELVMLYIIMGLNTLTSLQDQSLGKH